MSDLPDDPFLEETPRPKGKRGAPKGHPFYPSKRRKMNTKHLAQEVREQVDARIYVEFQLAILAGHDPRLEDDEGELRVTWDERGGIAPTLEQKVASLKWLADRGYGQAPQMIQLEAELRAGASSEALPIGALAPTTLAALARLLLPKPQETPALEFPPAGALDVEYSEVPTDEATDQRPPLNVVSTEVKPSPNETASEFRAVQDAEEKKS